MSHQLSIQGSNRATRFALSNRIVTIGDKTYVAWLDQPYPNWVAAMVAVFDRSQSTWSSPIAVHVRFDADAASHSTPTIAADRNGDLHYIIGSHNTQPFQYYRIPDCYNRNTWKGPLALGTLPTYPSFVVRKNRHNYWMPHVVYRSGDRTSPTWNMEYCRNLEDDETSTTTLAICDAATGGNYRHYHQSITTDTQGNGYLYVAFDYFHNDGTNKSPYGCFLWCDPGIGGGTLWMNAENQVRALPERFSTCDGVIFVEDDYVTVLNTTFNPVTNTPWILVSRQPTDEQHYLSLHHYSGNTWKCITVCDENGTKIETDDSGTLSIDGGGTIYIGVIVDSKVVLLTASNLEGTSFTKTIVQDSESQPHAAVSIERFTGGNAVGSPTLLFSTGERNGLRHVVRAAP